MKRLLLVLVTIAGLAIAVPSLPAHAYTCGSVTTSINYDCSGNNGLIQNFLLGIVRFLGELVGLVVILMIIIGGIQYMTSNGDPKAITAAKSRITQAVTALVLYLLMFGILHFLLPGTF